MLNEQLRTELKQWLFDMLKESLFYDDMLDDYIMFGLDLKGLSNMSDEELIGEYESCVQDDSDEFLIRLKLDFETHKMLSK